MFKRLWLRWAVCAVLTACAGFAASADGEHIFPSLNIALGAAAVGTGQSGSADSADAYSIYWNPAGLALASQTEVAAMSNAWVLDVQQSCAALAHPLSDKIGAGFLVSYLDYGEIVRRDDNGNETGQFRPYDLVAGAGLGANVGAQTHIGAAVKYLLQEIDGESANGVALDIGIRREFLNGRASAAASAHHIGNGIGFNEERFPLPTSYRIGGAYRFSSAALVADAVFPSGADPLIGAGMSVRPLELLTLRCGYRYEFGGNDLGALSGLTVGFGLHIEPFTIDYALVSMGSLGPSNRVSVAVLF
ncbi:MAG: PorV/PorQ family protein [Candidatus Poribacteria bacterium]|nr:PorV/PorQ family protein [Candidatus Poribacteria bacterium]